MPRKVNLSENKRSSRKPDFLGDDDTTYSSQDLASDLDAMEIRESETGYALDSTNNFGAQSKANVSISTRESMERSAINRVDTTIRNDKVGVQKQIPRKQRNPQRGLTVPLQSKAFKETVMPRLPFSRLAREILLSTSTDATKITRTALEALQEASEMYLTQQLQDAFTLTLHRGCVTLCVRDMELLRFIRNH